MCLPAGIDGFNHRECNHLVIKAFCIRLLGLRTESPIPDFLTLLYLPRTSGSELEIGGSKIRPGSKAYVALQRVVNRKTRKGEAIYGNAEKVRAGDGVRFEVYLREEKVLKGAFTRGDGDEWEMECACGLERETDDVLAAEVCVAGEGKPAMLGRVQMVVKRRRRCSHRGVVLEDIPEGVEVDEESDVQCCSTGDVEVDGGDSKEVVDLEGIRWAVDLGIWVVSLGVGYLVAKAAGKSLRRLRIL